MLPPGLVLGRLVAIDCRKFVSVALLPDAPNELSRFWKSCCKGAAAVAVVPVLAVVLVVLLEELSC